MLRWWKTWSTMENYNWWSPVTTEHDAACSARAVNIQRVCFRQRDLAASTGDTRIHSERLRTLAGIFFFFFCYRFKERYFSKWLFQKMMSLQFVHQLACLFFFFSSFVFLQSRLSPALRIKDLDRLNNVPGPQALWGWRSLRSLPWGELSIIGPNFKCALVYNKQNKIPDRPADNTPSSGMGVSHPLFNLSTRKNTAFANGRNHSPLTSVPPRGHDENAAWAGKCKILIRVWVVLLWTKACMRHLNRNMLLCTRLKWASYFSLSHICIYIYI